MASKRREKAVDTLFLLMPFVLFVWAVRFFPETA